MSWSWLFSLRPFSVRICCRILKVPGKFLWKCSSNDFRLGSRQQNKSNTIWNPRPIIDPLQMLLKAFMSGMVREQIANLDSICWKTPCAIFWSNRSNPGSLRAFCEAAPIIKYKTGIILGSNFRYQGKEINWRILINYVRDAIAEEYFRNNERKESPTIS